MTAYHAPIMVEEALSFLQPSRGGVYVDGTLGGGGHAEAVLKALPAGGRLYGIDRDAEAIAEASARLVSFGDSFTAIKGNFFDMRSLLHEKGIQAVDGIMLDLGVSSHQINEAARGFSYHNDAPLDMRMDASAPLSAYDVVNGYPVEELARILREYGEERFSFRIASAIVREREKEPITSTARLADIIKYATPPDKRFQGQHPARRSFQGIRIEVNKELDGLREALESAVALLNPGGRICVITFHSLEDFIVKDTFRKLENPCTCPPKAPMCICGKTPVVRILTKKPVIPGGEELEANSRAHSAKMRAAEKR